MYIKFLYEYFKEEINDDINNNNLVFRALQMDLDYCNIKEMQ